MKKLKIGFVIKKESRVPAWYFRTIRQVADNQAFEICFLVFSGWVRKVPEKNFAYRCFEQFENWWFRPEHDAMTELSVAGIDGTRMELDAERFQVRETELHKLKQLGLDLIYTIDYQPGEAENLSGTASYGLWHIQFGTEKYLGRFLPALAEVMTQEAVTGSFLLMHKEGKDRVVYEGTTVSVPYSVKNNLNALAWKAASHLPHRLHGLLQLDALFFERFNRQLELKEDIRLPGNVQMAGWFLRNLFRYLIYKLKSWRRRRFTLLFASGHFDPEKINHFSFQPLPLPPGRFFADPFVMKKEGKTYIFFEDYSEEKNKAHISLIEYDGSRFSEPLAVIEAAYHLSYPFVFSHGGHYYMIPETAAQKKLTLYRAKHFPYGWEFVKNLVEGKELIDATLHFENGRWWLFANSADHPAASTNDQLFVFYSDSLLSGEWQSHPMNPVVTHAGNCRPAGRLFRYKGRLFRPAQDNASQQYGHGLKINEVLVLTETDYQEKEVWSFNRSAQKLLACHHIDFSDELIVLDGVPQ